MKHIRIEPLVFYYHNINNNHNSIRFTVHQRNHEGQKVTSRHATSRRVTPRRVTPHHTASRLVASRHAKPRNVSSRHATPRHVSSRHATPRRASSRHAAPRFFASRHVKITTIRCRITASESCIPFALFVVLVKCPQLFLYA